MKSFCSRGGRHEVFILFPASVSTCTASSSEFDFFLNFSPLHPLCVTSHLMFVPLICDHGLPLLGSWKAWVAYIIVFIHKSTRTFGLHPTFLPFSKARLKWRHPHSNTNDNCDCPLHFILCKNMSNNKHIAHCKLHYQRYWTQLRQKSLATGRHMLLHKIFL